MDRLGISDDDTKKMSFDENSISTYALDGVAENLYMRIRKGFGFGFSSKVLQFRFRQK